MKQMKSERMWYKPEGRGDERYEKRSRVTHT